MDVERAIPQHVFRATEEPCRVYQPGEEKVRGVWGEIMVGMARWSSGSKNSFRLGSTGGLY